MLTTHLATLSFVAPWMAWGAVAAVGLPLLAHLLSRTTYRPVVFPAARLVRQAVSATSRIESPRHRLLMLLRWLVLLLLVIALMRPQWTPEAQAVASEDGIALILLMDASASMRRTEDGATLYGRALREAKALIGRLDPSRDVAAVVRVDRAPTPLLPEATAQFDLLMEGLGATRPGYTTADWQGALGQALQLIGDESRAVRLVTLSDQQGGPPSFSLIDGVVPRPTIDHIRVPAPTDNTAIRLLDVRPYPPIAGQPIEVMIEVRHFGETPVTAQLTARLDGDTTRQSLVLEPGATRRIELRLDGIAGGDGLLQVSLETPDAISADNHAGAWLRAEVRPRVLVVHDATAASQTLAKRIATLMNPGEVRDATLPAVDLQPIDKAEVELSTADPARLRTVVLVNREPVPDALSQSLEAYAQAGGGVVHFVSEDGDNPQRVTTAAGIDFDLQPLRIFEGPARTGLAALQWPGVGSTPIDARAQPILLDADGRVIVAVMPRGRGRLVAITAAVSAGPGGLLAEPAFVVLFNELCRYASPGAAMPAAYRPGDPLPDDLQNAAQTTSPDAADPEADTFTAPGWYAALDARGQRQAGYWVRLDSAESDTRPSPVWSVVEGQTGASDAMNTASTDDVAASVRSKPVEWWPYLLVGVFGLAGVESLLLWRFAGARSDATQGGGP